MSSIISFRSISFFPAPLTKEVLELSKDRISMSSLVRKDSILLLYIEEKRKPYYFLENYLKSPSLIPYKESSMSTRIITPTLWNYMNKVFCSEEYFIPPSPPLSEIQVQDLDEFYNTQFNIWEEEHLGRYGY
jgi:hypothetical protein